MPRIVSLGFINEDANHLGRGNRREHYRRFPGPLQVQLNRGLGRKKVKSEHVGPCIDRRKRVFDTGDAAYLHFD
jgi:hypothetical protein